jgi:peroxiredoxin
VLAEGARVPEATVFDPDLNPVDLSALAASGPYLLAFYLYDWTST